MLFTIISFMAVVAPWLHRAWLAFPAWVWVALCAANALYATWACWRDGRGPRLRLFYWSALYLMNLTYMPLILRGLIGINKRRWDKTNHTQALSISDMV